jgi:hypothetical protein
VVAVSPGLCIGEPDYLVMPKDYRLHEHNFQNVAGDAMRDMSALSQDGWEVNTAVIGFPYIHVLWERDVDWQAPEADHTACTAAQAAIARERDELKEYVAVSARSLEETTAQRGALDGERSQAVSERDEARNVARQLKAELEQAQSERDQLRAQLTAREQ